MGEGFGNFTTELLQKIQIFLPKWQIEAPEPAVIVTDLTRKSPAHSRIQRIVETSQETNLKNPKCFGALYHLFLLLHAKK